MTTVSLYEPIAQDLALVDGALAAIAEVEYKPLQRMLTAVLAGEGKRLRPALALLSGKFGTYDLGVLVPTAASIELLHTASLVHDDVIDSAALRRGRATANNLFGNAASVMLGDYMFGHAAHLIASTGSTRVVSLFAATIMEIVSGELHQDFTAFDYSSDVQDYFGRIGGKTASLFAAACEAGALVTGCDEPVIAALRDYGRQLGMAFQIVDDILDFVGNEALLGKPVGGDLLAGTLTLPALLLMERRPEHNVIQRLGAPSARHSRRVREARLAEALSAIRESGVIAESQQVARDFMKRALDSLESLPAGNGAKAALVDLAEYVLSRST